MMMVTMNDGNVDSENRLRYHTLMNDGDDDDDDDADDDACIIDDDWE